MMTPSPSPGFYSTLPSWSITYVRTQWELGVRENGLNRNGSEK